jgi:hypothetical protein
MLPDAMKAKSDNYADLSLPGPCLLALGQLPKATTTTRTQSPTNIRRIMTPSSGLPFWTLSSGSPQVDPNAVVTAENKIVPQKEPQF